MTRERLVEQLEQGAVDLDHAGIHGGAQLMRDAIAALSASPVQELVEELRMAALAFNRITQGLAQKAASEIATSRADSIAATLAKVRDQ